LTRQLALELLLLVPVVGGTVYGVLCMVATARFRRRVQTHRVPQVDSWPPVTILKPIYGLEKNLEMNLRRACSQDYPDYQVVLSAQRRDEPALALMQKIARECGSERVTVAVEQSEPVVNGKMQNLGIGLRVARHEVLVTSDSDMLVSSDFLRTIVARLRDPRVGCVCTLYRAVGAVTWYEKLELLSLNADFVVNLVFADMTGASMFCLGSSSALRRGTLEEIGGLESLSDYLVEDFELGRRIRGLGLRLELVPYLVDTVVSLESVREWWDHQVYWDLNTRWARPKGFFATVLLKSVPFAVLFAAARGFDSTGVLVVVGALAARLATTAWNLAMIGDREGLRSLGLLPLRDLAGLITWMLALTRHRVVWRGIRFGLTREGRIVREA
jgi:ceramide glucosyltransferase